MTTGTREEVLIIRGWIQVAGGYWSHPKMNGGESRVTLEEAWSRQQKQEQSSMKALPDASRDMQEFAEQLREEKEKWRQKAKELEEANRRLVLARDKDQKTASDALAAQYKAENERDELRRHVATVMKREDALRAPQKEAAQRAAARLTTCYQGAVATPNTFRETAVDIILSELNAELEKSHSTSHHASCKCLACDPMDEKRKAPLCPDCEKPMTKTSDAVDEYVKWVCACGMSMRDGKDFRLEEKKKNGFAKRLRYVEERIKDLNDWADRVDEVLAIAGMMGTRT